MKGLRLLVAVSAAVLTIVASPAHAQSAGGTSKPARQERQRKAAPRKVLRVEELKVEGRVQKPQAMFLMPRANVDAGERERSESFVSQVKGAVEKDPF